MKKAHYLHFFLLFLVSAAWSQETANSQDASSGGEIKSKKGEAYLPEAGDWAIGIDVAPFFNYVGNVANGNTSNSSPSFDYTNSFQVFGKWFRESDLAWRGRIRFLGIDNNTIAAHVNDDLNTDPLVPKVVEDKKTMSRMATTLGFGIEKRKGKTRLQGFYGAEAVISFATGSDKYSYGNDITGTNPAPSSYTFDSINMNPPNGYRVTEVSYGTMFSFGVRPFIGAEYFIFPKMSIGGEFGYMLGFTSTSSPEVTSEFYDAVNAVKASNTIKYGLYDKSSFMMDNDNLSGSIKLMLHF